MTKYGCTVARSDFYPVASERHRLRSEVETIQWDDLFTDNHPRRRSVISDSIRKFDLPVGDPAVNELQRGADAACCRQDSINVDAWPFKSLASQKAISGSMRGKRKSVRDTVLLDAT